MEQHAVPQDITGFKFKLVGDMTLKQFGELAAGAIIAYLFFASPLHPFIKWPFVIFFAFFGIALAFLPIQERPLDTWIINFFKAIYKPTYFTWRKDATGGVDKPPEVKQGFVPLSVHHEVAPLMAADNISDPVTTVKSVTQTQPETVSVAPPPPSPSPAPEPEKEKPEEPAPANSGVLSIDELLKQRQESTPTPPAPTMTIDDLMTQREHTTAATVLKADSDLSEKEAKFNEMAEKNKELMMKVDELRNQIYNISNSGGDASKLMPELDQLMVEKNQALSNMTKAREEMTAQRVAPLAQPAYKEPIRDPNAVTRPKPQPVPPPPVVPVPLTSQANVVNGVVTDANGAPLDGVIITIKDMQANPVRALRTSKLGNFIANTPMPSGEYYLELEKNGQNFDVWKITLDGSVLTPVEIRAKQSEQTQS